MVDQVGEKAIKMSLIQTLPGEEFKVVASLKNEYETNVGIEKFSLYKGLGSFDIISLCAVKSFDFHLKSAMPIDGILKSSLFFCFPCMAQDIDLIFNNLSKSIFTGISMLKLNPDKIINTNHLKEIIDSITSKHPDVKVSVLGTLGWNEIILLINTDNINSLVNALFWATEQKANPTFIKTSSFVSINFNILTTFDETTISRKQIEERLASIKGLNSTIDVGLIPTICVSAEPLYTHEIGHFWHNLGYEVEEIIGRDDIRLIPKKNKETTWSELIGSILSFRCELKGKILSTCTSINRKFSNSREVLVMDIRKPNGNKRVTYKLKELADTFGEDAAAKLAIHFNSLNGFLQNPLICSVFKDMAAYPNYVLINGGLRKLNNKEQHLAIQAGEVLKSGAELRLYGTYGTTDDRLGYFSRHRGGCQRALSALESLPTSILRRLGGEWDGFIIAGSNKFQTRNEVIDVPFDTLFTPKLWWPIYHEIAHIWIENKPELVGSEVPEIKLFLSQKNEHDAWIKFITELAAEVVGFELGFYGDIDLFMKLIWNHLTEIDKSNKVSRPTDVYVARTFFVYLFEKHFREKSISKEQFCNIDFLYEKMIEHMGEIENITENEIKNKQFIAAKRSIDFIELYPWAKERLCKQIDAYPIRKSKNEQDEANANDVVDCISKGIAWNDVINAPEAILYKILSAEGDLRFDESIATILTFNAIHENFLRPEKSDDATY